jgi:diguanylate cyclase (GGDEF)-like protein
MKIRKNVIEKSMKDTLSLNEVTSQLSTSKSKALLRDQIWFRQTVFTLSLTFILGLILSVATIALDLFDEQVTARRNAAEVVSAMRHQAAQAVFNIDPTLARTVVLGLGEYELFKHVRIIDDLGKDLYKTERELSQSFLSGIAGMLFSSEKPIVVLLKFPGVKDDIGRIEVRLDSYLVAEQFLQRSFRTIIGSFLRNITLSAGLLVLFYYTLTRPLIHLGRQINTIDPNNPDQDLVVSHWHKKSELGEMTDLLNLLLKRLKDVQHKFKRAEQALVDQNNKLESMVEERTRELLNANTQLNRLAITDPLTGVYNRRFFEEAGLKLVNKMQRHERTVVMLSCDLDNFKEINDRFGHAMGDEVLRGFAKCFSSIIRESDIFARHGGEEFIILLSDITLEEACVLGERLRSRFNETTFSHRGKSMTFSVSIGLSMAPLHSGYDMEELMMIADTALYKAKELGRNRLEIAS